MGSREQAGSNGTSICAIMHLCTQTTKKMAQSVRTNNSSGHTVSHVWPLQESSVGLASLLYLLTYKPTLHAEAREVFLQHNQASQLYKSSLHYLRINSILSLPTGPARLPLQLLTTITLYSPMEPDPAPTSACSPQPGQLLSKHWA